jgi:hypothetical protein
VCSGVEIAPHERLDELVERQGHRQRGEGDLARMLDLGEGEDPDGADDGRAREIGFGGEAHGSRLDSLARTEARDVP